MVQQSEIIELFKRDFIYKNGKLYWADHKRFARKEAGCKNKNGYIDIRVGTFKDNHIYQAHRIIFAIHNNYLPEIVDHIDRNTRNNYPDNLRAANKQINCINTGMFFHNTNGVKGVSYHKQTGKWTAQLQVNGIKKHLGLFNTIEDAAKARTEGERIYWPNL